MDKVAITASADIYLGDDGDMWARNAMNGIWENLRRSDLARRDPTPLDAPVYVEIARDMIHDSSRRTPFAKFIKGLNAKAAKAPKDCPVFVSYKQESGYEGDHWTWFEIGYERPPTKKEQRERKARNAEILEVKAEFAAEAAERERKDFERLKAKFDNEKEREQ